MDAERRLNEVVEGLRAAGARFGYLFGSRAEGGVREGSDIDLAAWFGRSDVDPLDIRGVDFESVDLVVLDSAPLDIAGRVAMRGELLFDDDPPARVRWEATTRKIYADERPRVERAWKDFVDATRQRIGRS